MCMAYAWRAGWIQVQAFASAGVVGNGLIEAMQDELKTRVAEGSFHMVLPYAACIGYVPLAVESGAAA